MLGKALNQVLSTIKKRISADCTMAYFNPKRNTELVVDISPVGLGAIHTQKIEGDYMSIVALASRS